MSAWIKEIEEPIYLVDKLTGERIADDDEPWDVKRYVYEICLTDPAIGQGIEASEAVEEITDILVGGPVNGHYKLTAAHHKRLKTTIVSPKAQRNQRGLSQLLEIQRRIRDAVTKDPTPAEDPAE